MEGGRRSRITRRPRPMTFDHMVPPFKKGGLLPELGAAYSGSDPPARIDLFDPTQLRDLLHVDDSGGVELPRTQLHE